MIIIVYFVAIYTLWDDVYIKMIEDDALNPPLIDIREITKDQECESDEVPLARSYWWGLRQGCSCTGGTAAAARLEVCTDKEARTQDCLDSKARDSKWLPIYNGHKMCGKRGDYNLHDMSKPKKNDQG
jgi:hypothetical protein